MQSSRLERLVEIGRQLVGELDLETLLTRIIDVGRDVTGARYAALGIMNADRSGLERFISVGLPPEEHAAIGDLPRGRGVLGVLIDEPHPLRLDDVGSHPRSYGFPLHHPPMRSFLGVPIVIGGMAWGNLYLTDKDAGPFDAEDEQAAVVLADWAAVAVSNARLFAEAAGRGEELERTVRGLEASTEIAMALGGLRDLPRILELVVKRARALVGARTVVVGLVDGSEVRVASAAGEGIEQLQGMVAGPEDLLTTSALRTRRPDRVPDVRMRRCAAAESVGALSALAVPLRHRDRALGVLVAFDRLDEEGTAFTQEDERLMLAFAVSAASAVASALDSAREVSRRSIRATEQERGRFARELHDATVQELAALKLSLSAAARQQDPEVMRAALTSSADTANQMIAELRRLITDLRPAALDQLGLHAALEVLVERVAEQSGLDVDLSVDLAFGTDQRAERLSADLEAAAYRIVQEALTNSMKHAAATRLEVRVTEEEGRIRIRVADDGRGFDPNAATTGFGLLGMRERVDLLGGALTIGSTAGQGTVVSAALPVSGDTPVSAAEAAA